MMHQPHLRRLFLTFAAVLLLCNHLAAQDLTVPVIMAEPSIAGMRAENESLSPDGTKIIYLWNPEGRMPLDLYLASTSGGPAKMILKVSDLPEPKRPPEKENKLDYGLTLRDDFVKERENRLGSFEWSPDSSRLVFAHGGDIYLLTPGEKPVRLTQTAAGEFGARFLDNDRLLYQQSGNIFIWDLNANRITQVSNEANPQSSIAVFNPVPNEAGTMIAYVVSDSSKYRSLVVPNYLGEFTTAPSTRRGWSEQKLMVMPADGSRDTPFEIKLPKPEGVGGFRRIMWAADGRSLIVDRGDKDSKRRQLFYVKNVGAADEQITLVTEETDPKWLAPLSSIVEADPKNASRLFFASERDGFNHIYLAQLSPQTAEGTPNTAAVSTRQLTKGNWQVEWAQWNLDGSEIIYSSTQNGTATRDFFAVNAETGQVRPIESTADKGMRSSPQMNREGSRQTLVYEFSQWERPGDLFAVNVCSGCGDAAKPVELTDTVPAAFKARKWITPKFIDIPSRDGKKIAAKIYLPPGHDARAKAKYPMVIFVHGAGYLQNVINGWNNYYREFMFNETLASRGYVFLDIDYRGSAGYGRDWRTDVYDFLGGKDFDDHIDAIDHMTANYNVNRSRIGVYGGSYGGFMAEMLAMRAPDRTAAAAALRPVADWKNYYASSPGYTVQRLGFPDKNPEAYRRSSPITYADKLERPLLILHGMSDDNVHVQDSVQLIEKLIRLGKTPYFEAMLYPSENHGFVRPASWTDEYERIQAFFEKHLR